MKAAYGAGLAGIDPGIVTGGDKRLASNFRSGAIAKGGLAGIYRVPITLARMSLKLILQIPQRLSWTVYGPGTKAIPVNEDWRLPNK